VIKIQELLKDGFSGLRALPTIRFALMLGAGVIVTLFAGALTSIITWAPWPDSVAGERVRWLGIALCIALGLIGLVMMALSNIRLDKISISTPAGSGELDLASGEDPPAEQA